MEGSWRWVDGRPLKGGLACRRASRHGRHGSSGGPVAADAVGTPHVSRVE